MSETFAQWERRIRADGDLSRRVTSYIRGDGQVTLAWTDHGEKWELSPPKPNQIPNINERGRE